MKIDKNEIGKNKVFGLWMYYLKTGGGIHGKIKNWKDGDPHREPAFAPIFEQEVADSEVLFDIGANIGYYSLMAARCDVRVYALEPDPRNAHLLSRAVKANGFENLISVHDVAVSDKRRTADFYLSKATNLSAMTETEHTSQTVKVQTMSLSMFSSRKRLIGPTKSPKAFIRMDIEGHEVEALRGMYSLFAWKFPCKIFMEVHPQFYSEDHDLEPVLRKVLSFGFSTKVVISAAVACPDLFRQRGYLPDSVYDCGRFERGVYYGMKDEDMIEFSCKKHRQDFDFNMFQRSGETHSDKIVRSVLLERS
jgi:FkbM family methyltransferase